MTATPPPTGASEFSDSDQQWFDRLSGKVTGVTHASAVHEADVLRDVLAAERDQADVDPALDESLSPQAQERSWQQVQFRLRQEQAKRQRSSWLRRAGVGTALAAGVLVAVVVLQSPREATYYDEPPTFRGELDVTRLVSDQPRQAAEALAQALSHAGLAAAPHQRGKVFSVDAVVATDTPVAALELLRRNGVKAGLGNKRVEFAPP